MAIKLKFGYLISMLGDEFGPGELLIEGKVIREVSRVPIEPFEGEVVDLGDCLIMPGFVNAHCHLSLSALKGKVSRDLKFCDWVISLVEQNVQLSWSERCQALHEGAQDLLRSGVTTLADYLSHPDLIPEYQSLPFRQVLFLETLGFRKDRVQETCARVQGVLDSNMTQGEKFKLGIAPHAPYSVAPELFRRLKDLAHRYSCPFSSHVAEIPEETRFLQDGQGDLLDLLKNRNVYEETWKPPQTSPLEYLESLGVVDSLVAVHLNHIENDLDILQICKAGAVFCPGSTRWFGREKFMPVRRLLDRRVPVALGTDSLASNESLDFLYELRVARDILPEVSRRELLSMATRQGARVLGSLAGTIAPGRFADIIGFRVQGKHGPWKNVPFEPDRKQVDFSMIDGKVVLS